VKIGRIKIGGQLWQKVNETSILTHKLDMVVHHYYNPSYLEAQELKHKRAGALLK
jgi:hypothetical protein